MKLSISARLRGILFAIGYHLLSWVSFLLIFSHYEISDFALILPALVGLAAIPLYFCVKGQCEGGYGGAVLLSNIVMIILEMVIYTAIPGLSKLFIPWLSPQSFAGLALLYVWIMIGSVGTFVSLLDGVICLVQRLMKGREF